MKTNNCEWTKPRTVLVKEYFKYTKICNEYGMMAKSFDKWIKEAV